MTRRYCYIVSYLHDYRNKRSSIPVQICAVSGIPPDLRKGWFCQIQAFHESKARDYLPWSQLAMPARWVCPAPNYRYFSHVLLTPRGSHRESVLH